MLKQLFIFILGCSWAMLFAQEPLRFTTKQGLPTNHIYEIAQDEHGFMWFATKQGLVKYDGETFKTFTIQDGLPNNDTWKLEMDYQGRLWYFSKSQYQGYIKNDSIYSFTTKNKDVLVPSSYYKSKESLWFYASGVFTLENGQLFNTLFYSTEYFSDYMQIQLKHGYNEDSRMSLIINPELEQLVFMTNQKLFFYDYDYNLIKEQRLDNKIDFPITYKPKNREIQENGLLYNQIGYYINAYGFVFIDYKTGRVTHQSFEELTGVKKVGYARCYSNKKNIQITIPGHLMVYDYQLNLLNTYHFPKKLSYNSFQDSYGNIWMADLANGISLIPATQNKASYFLLNKKVQKVNKIENNFFAGAQGDGYYKLDTTDHAFNQLYSFSNPYVEVYHIKTDKATGDSYFVSANTIMVWEEGKLRQVVLKKSIAGKIINVYDFKDIGFFKNDAYYLTSGSILKNTQKEEYASRIFIGQGLFLLEHFKDRLYVGRVDGLSQIIKENMVPLHTDKRLMSVSVLSMLSTNKYLMVGTDGRGVYLLDKKNAVYYIKETDGLSVKCILKKDNQLWLATQKGVFKIQLDEKHPKQSKIIDAFFESDGLLQNNTNDIYLDHQYLYAATDIGLTKIDLENKQYKPKLYFKTQSDTIYFKNEARNNISISFAALDFINQEHLTYQYRLLPQQKEWTSTGSQTLHFSNLSADIYTLEVKTTNQHNVSTVQKQYLQIIPYWWETTWAIILFILFGLLILAALIWALLKWQRKKLKTKEELKRRISGLELQALRSQMNPHFVHNSLNAIQYFIQRNEVELSENYLSRFSQLIRLFFEYSRRQTITIQEELELLTNYLEIEKLRFEEKLQYKITVCEKLDIEEQPIPSMLLQPIVENAVNHGLFHKKEQGNVELLFKKLKDNIYQVTVKDDGIGINRAKSIFKVSSKNYQSNSSKVLHERLDLLNQSNNWKIDYSIKDISEIEQGKTGTLVTLIFTKNH